MDLTELNKLNIKKVELNAYRRLSFGNTQNYMEKVVSNSLRMVGQANKIARKKMFCMFYTVNFYKTGK